MDETMDVSTDSAEGGTEGEIQQSTAMDTSPILSRSSSSFSRTPRNLVSSSGWITPRIARRQLSTVASPSVTTVVPDPNPSENLDEPSTSSNHHNVETQPITLPPVEDSHPMMIDQSSSLTSPVMDDGLIVSTEAPSPTQEENDNHIDDSVEIISEVVPIPIGNSSTMEAPDLIVLEDQPSGTVEEVSTMPVDALDEPPPAAEPTSPTGPDVENVPLAQRIRSPDLLSPTRSPPPKKVKIEPEVTKAEDTYEEEEGKLCPICFDAWTNSGDHRLVSLKCGHLFGQQCIQHWLQIHKLSERRCPQCKKKATMKDLRPLYALKIRVLDTSEQEQLKETIKKLEEEKERLSRELAFERQLHQDAVKIQQEQQMKLQQLQNQGILTHSLNHQLPDTSRQIAAAAAQIKIGLKTRVEVSRDGGCRVLAFNEWKSILVASQSAVSPLFPDFGIKLIDTEEFRPRQSIPVHTKAIRDLSFNPHRKDLLLSASFDKTAKIFSLSSNSSVMNFNAEMPLWSCCWDGNNTNVFYVGSQNGTTFQYDLRNAHTEVSRITTPGEGAPVISLAAVPAGNWLPNGGFLSCRLNRLRVYERINNSEFRPYALDIEGPFSALNYNHKTHHMLVLTRPNSQNPHAQLQLYQMGFAGSQPQANLVHSYVGGTTARVMSRPCQVEIEGNIKDTLICAHLESEGHVAIWSVASGQKIPAGPLPCSEPIMDLCPLKVNNHTFLASLSEKSLRVYQFS